MAVLRTITGELDLEERIREGLNAAGALFMVCVHLLVPLTLMRNPEDFAEKARRTLANQSFKEDPTPRRMRNFVLDSITKKRRPVPGASIWDAGEEDDKDSCRGRSRARGSTNTRRSLPRSWDDQPDSAACPQGYLTPKAEPHSRLDCRARRPRSTPATFQTQQETGAKAADFHAGKGL